jgi:hypothetical protein
MIARTASIDMRRLGLFALSQLFVNKPDRHY